MCSTDRQWLPITYHGAVDDASNFGGSKRPKTAAIVHFVDMKVFGWRLTQSGIVRWYSDDHDGAPNSGMEDCPMRGNWRAEEVPAILQSIELAADRAGFLVAVYGSTMRKGVGRDLDLIAVQKRCGVAPKYLVESIAVELGAVIEHSESSLFAELCALLRLDDGRLIDIQVRLSKCGP